LLRLTHSIKGAELEGANWVVRRAERFLGAGADVV
jgi:hypothetical protein